MAVVRNLMIRIGADYSSAKKGMDGASAQLGRFKTGVTRTTSEIRGARGLGGIGTELRSLTRSTTESFDKISGAKGVGGVSKALGSLAPVARDAIGGLRGLAAAGEGAAAALGPVGIIIGVVAAGIGLAVAGLAKASQPAVKFEADLGRLNMQLHGSSRAFMDWARAQGLARATAADIGSTYGVLLSSFISDNKELLTQTEALTKATRVVASGTGRTIEDTEERIRSGLLGNTEAIEDLGVFVNVAMIESTKAFQKFANGKHWEQLDYHTQQQIRLQAILEQATARYGNSLQNNVMTKQTQLIESLKDVKLNLSETFLPIWNDILPALGEMAKGLAYVTEEIARFVYWLHGKNFDEATRGADKQGDSVSKLGDDYQKAGEQAQKAVASFDQLNLIGLAGSTGGNSGGSGTGGNSSPSSSSGNNSGSSQISNLPQLPKLQLQFETPSPPDAGAGGVATAVTGTINELIAQTKLKMAGMWGDIGAQGRAGALAQQALWGGLSGAVTGVLVPGLVAGIEGEYTALWAYLQSQMASGTAYARQTWQSWLSTMYSSLANVRRGISGEWDSLTAKIASIKSPLADVDTEWSNTLDDMQHQLNAYRPYLEYGWQLIDDAVLSLKSPLSEVEGAWTDTLSNMYQTATAKLGGIANQISATVSAWASMQSVLSGNTSSPAPSTSNAPAISTPSALPGRDLPVVGSVLKGLDWVAKVTKPLSEALEPFLVPGASAPALGGAGSAAMGRINQALQALSDAVKGSGFAIPGFASGAMVYGPTLAMVGDNRGAATNPEVIAPLSDLQSMITSGSDNAEVVVVLKAILSAIKSSGSNDTMMMSKTALGRAAASGLNDISRRTGLPLLTT